MLVASAWYFRPRITETEVENLIDKNLLVGTHEPEIEAFLDSRSLEHQSFSVKADPDSGATKYGSGVIHFITATIPDAQRGLITRYEIQIWLYLDDEDRLTGHMVRKAATMPHSILGL